MSCRYDPASLIGSKIGASVFTSTDARIVREIWRGPRTPGGQFLWWGPTPGTDLTNFADTEGSPPTGKPCPEGLDWFRYFLVRNPKWDWKTLTRAKFAQLFRKSVRQYSDMYGGDDPILNKFRRSGGKLLIVHGLADQFVPPQKSIDYYNAVSRRFRGSRQTQQFLRLFLVPGADHGFGNVVPAPSNFGMMNALMNWVERKHAPDQLGTELMGDDGKFARTRSIFPYPRVAPLK